MSWKGHLKKLKDGLNTIKSELQSEGSPQPSQQWQDQNAHQQPPPVDYRSKPPPPEVTAYWRPKFVQSEAVTTEWDAKLGNGPDGWGNQELQHYTALPENVF